jgi:hypothetical protein
MSWKPGPLPPDTYHWGGVVPTDHEGSGFYFADFRGGYVSMERLELVGTDANNLPIYRVHHRSLQPHEVRWYNNALDLPPNDNPHAPTPTATPPSSPEREGD